MASSPEDETILAKLDAVVPVPANLDAFPKLPSTYKTRSQSRGYLTIFVALVTFLLMLNDIGEYIWGWPDFDFTVDRDPASFMNINVDILINMPCQFLSVDLRDAIGDRLFLTSGFRRDGAKFDVSQASALQQHTTALSTRQVLRQSRSSRGLFDIILRSSGSKAQMPKYKHVPDASACRIVGQLEVKKVTANLHITTLGHGYASHIHVPHDKMNLSHVISEFSFGPYFPDIVQPLDNSFEVTNDHFVAYQYFLHIVPTTYVAPRSRPVSTNQYSVTHYTRVLEHGQGTPGIFFKFDLDPLSLQITQRTTSLVQLIIRCVGVIGGVFVCMGYAVRIGTRAVEVVTGADKASGIVAAEASGVKVGLRAKWGGSSLRSRPNRQSGTWGEDTNGSPYASYSGTPVAGTFGSPYLHSPAPNTGGSGSFPTSPHPSSPSVGLGIPSAGFGPPPMRNSSSSGPPRTPSLGVSRSSYGQHSTGGPYTPGSGSTYGGQIPGIPSYSNFPPTPNPANGGGFPSPSLSAHIDAGLGGPPKKDVKKDD